MRSLRSVLVALFVPFSLVAQADTWSDLSSLLFNHDDDRLSAAHLCRQWWADRLAQSLCLHRYDRMVSEHSANPYFRAAVSRSCAGDPCIDPDDPEHIAIERLARIYDAL